MGDGRHHDGFRGGVARQPVGDDGARHHSSSPQEFPTEALGGTCAPTALNEDIEHLAGVIDARQSQPHSLLMITLSSSRCQMFEPALVTFQLIEKSRLHFDDTRPRAASRRAWGVQLTPDRADVRDAGDCDHVRCCSIGDSTVAAVCATLGGSVVGGKHDIRENCGDGLDGDICPLMKPTARRSTEPGLV
jgi:hypothetical protein